MKPRKIKTGPFAGMTVSMAPQKEIAKYEERLYEMLEDVFDVTRAFITDESTFSNFSSLNSDALQTLHDDYGVEASWDMKLVDFAKQVWG